VRELVDPLAARAGVLVLADEMGERQAEDVLVEVARLLGVAAAVSSVVQAFDRDELVHLISFAKW
jgi:hypothetical protein